MPLLKCYVNMPRAMETRVMSAVESLKELPGYEEGEEIYEEHIIDLITNLLHLAGSQGFDVERILRLADLHCMAERGGEDE